MKYILTGLMLAAAVAFVPAMLAASPNINDYNHYTAYLEAINVKHDEAQAILAKKNAEPDTLSRWQGVLWTHVYHLLGLVKETVEFEQSNIWVWTDEYKWGHIKYIGALPQEAHRTFEQEESLRGCYDAQTRRITLQNGDGLENCYELPQCQSEPTRSVGPAPLAYTRLVTYLTEEVERLLGLERAYSAALQKSLDKLKPVPKAKPKPVLLEEVQEVADLPLAPAPETKPAEPELPAFEEDDVDGAEGLFAFLALPELNFDGIFDGMMEPDLARSILLASGAIAGSLTVVHVTDRYYLNSAISKRIASTLGMVRTQLGKSIRLLHLDVLRRALARSRDAAVTTGAYIAQIRIVRGLRELGGGARTFVRRMAHGTREKFLHLGRWLSPGSYDFDM